jgi:hypothetical protein
MAVHVADAGNPGDALQLLPRGNVALAVRHKAAVADGSAQLIEERALAGMAHRDDAGTAALAPARL